MKGNTMGAAGVPHPFIQAFPRLSLAVRLIAATCRALAAVHRRLWPYRREIAVVLVVMVVWHQVAQLGPVVGLAVYLAGLGVVAGVGPVRRAVMGWLSCGVTRR